MVGFLLCHEEILSLLHSSASLILPFATCILAGSSGVLYQRTYHGKSK